MTAERRFAPSIATIALAVFTALCGALVAIELRLDPDVVSLLPERGESAALRRYLHAFGGSDLALILVRAGPAGGDVDRVGEVKAAAEAIASRLQPLPSVRFAAAGIDSDAALDPMLVWRHADAGARARLAEALSPAGMRARLNASRALLLAPGAGSASERILADPLRLAALLHEARGVGGGFRAQADGAFASDDGLARLVLVCPKGQALRGRDAHQFVAQARAVIDEVSRSHPSVTIGLSGGHAIAEATERMLLRDLRMSSALSLALAAVAFALSFRRLRALVAVMPPLVLGTLSTAAVASLWPGGLSAIAVAFMSVVIGVGVDTGVHVYAALLQARHAGLDPQAAARAARDRTKRPVLVAAAIAASAFAALGLSEIRALQQLGLLCAAGELLTALAIVAWTPVIGAWLERAAPPRLSTPRWIAAAGWLTARRTRAYPLLVLTAVPLVLTAFGVRPAIGESIVALRPARLEPLQVQEAIYRQIGGRHGQWVVLVGAADRQQAMERADAVAERLAGMSREVESVDALTALLPARATQQARLAERDRLDLPAKADELERALGEVGFRPARFAAALHAMRHAPSEWIELGEVEKTRAAILTSRYLGKDEQELVALYVLPRPGHEDAVARAIVAVDPRAAITGYARLDRSLRASLAADLPAIGLVAALLVLAALALSLRRWLDVALAVGVVAAQIGVVLLLVRLLQVPLHAYDALVLPVLLGITVDEAMFLLHRARTVGGGDVVRETLALEGPAVATTGLTTAAGFAGLWICDFDGLRHLGIVGAIGSLAGLLAAFVIVPAGLRLAARPRCGR